MNLQTRIEKLEQRTTEETDVSDINLYDINGEQINAKILRLPKTWENGLAVLQNGTEIPIAPIGNWTDIILESERLLNRENSKIDDGKAKQEDYSDVLFLRRNGQVSATESLLTRRLTMIDNYDDIGNIISHEPETVNGIPISKFRELIAGRYPFVCGGVYVDPSVSGGICTPQGRIFLNPSISIAIVERFDTEGIPRVRECNSLMISKSFANVKRWRLMELKEGRELPNFEIPTNQEFAFSLR